MIISQSAREAAVRIAMKHISLNPSEEVIEAVAKDVQRELDQAKRPTDVFYFVMKDGGGKNFWDGTQWVAPAHKVTYTDFDVAVKEYRKANLACEEKVTIAHSTPTGVVRYQPI